MTRFSAHPGWITLVDGPGIGQTFHVQRAPVFVRVVETESHEWNILDQLDDEPTDHEEIFVYKQARWVHVRASTQRASGVYYTYVHIPIEATLKATLRYTSTWQEWASNQPL